MGWTPDLVLQKTYQGESECEVMVSETASCRVKSPRHEPKIIRPGCDDYWKFFGAPSEADDFGRRIQV